MPIPGKGLRSGRGKLEQDSNLALEQKHRDEEQLFGTLRGDPSSVNEILRGKQEGRERETPPFKFRKTRRPNQASSIEKTTINGEGEPLSLGKQGTSEEIARSHTCTGESTASSRESHEGWGAPRL